MPGCRRKMRRYKIMMCYQLPHKPISSQQSVSKSDNDLNTTEFLCKSDDELLMLQLMMMMLDLYLENVFAFIVQKN
jgi:hypothetical protein